MNQQHGMNSGMNQTVGLWNHRHIERRFDAYAHVLRSSNMKA